MGRVIDGKAIAQSIREGLAQRLRLLQDRMSITPGLAVISVGENPASQIYVANKMAACRAVGVHSIHHRLPTATSTEHLIELVTTLNSNAAVHGVLVQLPLPPHIDMRLVLESIAVEKDVDSFHLYNVGGLVVGGKVFSPCTPYGVMRLLEHEQIPIAGQNAVVVGASNIVGKPMALMLMQREATVCICHARTRDLAQFTILADILVVAVGQPNLITPPMVKTGAVVIDVGINRLDDGRIIGDVEFAGVQQKAAYITPVPGGVGPMTVTMLLENTIVAAERTATRNYKAFSAEARPTT